MEKQTEKDGKDKKEKKEKKEKQENSASESSGKRTCRCMFCGENLLLESEEAAVDHMRVCPYLQEQLASKDQFTLPAELEKKLKKKPGET